MSALKKGSNNPMFGKEKSKEFIENMLKDRKGINNPMFGKIKSEETLAKIRKTVYVYNCDKTLINFYESVGLAVKDLHISSETIKKYKDTGKTYKNLYFYSKKL
jgi:group I intron endonuclease